MTEQPGTEPTPAAEPKKRNIKGIARIAIIALVVIGGGVYYLFFNDSVTTAKVGDCITESVKADASDAKVVDCGKPEAKNKVVGIVKNVSEADFDTKNQDLCAAYPTWETVIWHGSKSSGDAWCLEPIK